MAQKRKKLDFEEIQIDCDDDSPSKPSKSPSRTNDPSPVIIDETNSTPSSSLRCGATEEANLTIPVGIPKKKTARKMMKGKPEMKSETDLSVSRSTEDPASSLKEKVGLFFNYQDFVYLMIFLVRSCIRRRVRLSVRDTRVVI